MGKSKVHYDRQRDAINTLKSYMNTYSTVYVFSYKNIKARYMRELVASKEWQDSKILFGVRKVICGALYNLITKHSPWRDLEELMRMIKGPIGILLTNRPQSQVKEWFNNFAVWDYPRTGYLSYITIQLEKGPLPQFQPEIEPYLSQLGLQTMVVDGVVFLKKPFLVCKAGTILNAKTIGLLQLLGEKLSAFQLRLKAIWTKEGGLEVQPGGEDSDEESVDSEQE